MNSPRHDAVSGIYVERWILDAYILDSPPVKAELPFSPPPAASAVQEIRRDDAWRHERVSTAAYYLAAKRGFEPGHDAEDWSHAELETDAIDAGRTL